MARFNLIGATQIPAPRAHFYSVLLEKVEVLFTRYWVSTVHNSEEELLCGFGHVDEKKKQDTSQNVTSSSDKPTAKFHNNCAWSY